MSTIRTTSRLLILLTLIMVSSNTGIAQDSATIDPATLDPAAMEKLWKDFRKLAPEHEGLKFMVGEYDTVSHDYAMGPENPVTEKGTATFKLLMGGRYLRQQYKSTYGGVSFNGEGLSGFDKSTGKYFGTWIDNFSTGIMTTEGTYDPRTHTMTEIGTGSGPLGPMTMKLVTSPAEAPAKFKMTMFTTLPDDSEMKIMDIIYTPKAAE